MFGGLKRSRDENVLWEAGGGVSSVMARFNARTYERMKIKFMMIQHLGFGSLGSVGILTFTLQGNH